MNVTLTPGDHTARPTRRSCDNRSATSEDSGDQLLVPHAPGFRDRPSTVHYYGIFDDKNRLMVLISMNSDVSDSWEREGDNQAYFDRYSPSGYALGVDVVWVLTH